MKPTLFFPAVVALGAVLLPACLNAQILVNPGFESDLTGWKSSGNLGAADQAATLLAWGFSPIEGTKLAAFNGGNSTPDGVLSQSFGTVVGGTYAVSYYVARGGSGLGDVGLQGLVADASNNVLASATDHPVATGWSSAIGFSFVATTTTTTLIFSDVSQVTDGVDLGLDQVDVKLVAVPEPAEYAAAAGLALVAFGIWRRCRR
jgi:hypothetical protein